MKTIDSIPVGKLRRAGKLMATGVKVGANQVVYVGEKLFNPEDAREKRDKKNAEDIYDSLSELKGSSLKVAQMLSMDKSILPAAYVDKFSLSQFSVPPLSAPLVNKTFKKYFGKYPNELFDSFEMKSTNAASIGQVHKGNVSGVDVAVKIQYPGVAESISSDLSLVKPIAKQMFDLKGKEIEKYFKEVETKLLEETDYILELHQSEEITSKCRHIKGVKFPKYYPSFSNEKVITMEWMDGVHLSEFVIKDLDQEVRNKVGQSLWDFYMFQIHELRKVHADPHPGNFLVDENNNLVAIDFGCIKQIPDEFYNPYFELSDYKILNDDKLFYEKLYALEILRTDDTAVEVELVAGFFKELLTLFTLPFQSDHFDFDDQVFFDTIATKGEQVAKDPKMKKLNQSRGSKHFLYMNRTFFGLYNLMYDLKATVKVNTYIPK